MKVGSEENTKLIVDELTLAIDVLEQLLSTVPAQDKIKILTLLTQTKNKYEKRLTKRLERDTT